ncbi:hypothetical protein GF354_03895 [Candidatus Peregrinibacteria bacterium]|nr:hypothetical protein [Candidatus Peregrinibacteria bacterium]
MRNDHINKTIFLIIGSGLITGIIIIKLFILQVIQHGYYQDIATKEQYGYMELTPQRGEIIIRDHHSGEDFLIGTNSTLDLLYADPSLIKDPVFLAKTLSPLIFEIEEERAADNERIEELAKNLSPDLTEEEIAELLKPKTDEELKTQFEKNLTASLAEKQRQEILLNSEMEEEDLKAIKELNLPGIEIKDDKVYAHPPEISNRNYIADSISEYVKIPKNKLKKILIGENRYIVLKRKLDPEISEKILEYIKNDENELFDGIGLLEEYYRYYPENTLAANIVGYVDRNNHGQYGIESTFDKELAGKTGKIQTKRDSVGRQITVGESVIEPVQDGDDIVLTIDRSIQLKVEEILARAVEYYRADSGQVIIMDPKTGAIIAMANYPSFDPNEYGQVFEKEEIEFTPEEMQNLYPSDQKGIYYYYRNPITLDHYTIFEEKDEEGNSVYYRYKNIVGPEVYHNKIVSWPYEPGSVFKSITMAIALDDGSITPSTVYNDVGPIEVDFNVNTGEYDFEIKNSDGYYGLVDMNTVLAKSLNTGMTFIAKEIGPALFYNYMEKFGFLDKTDIEFNAENTGKIEYFEDWTESELATHAFGQGITVTMLQLANAYCALANGGILMQPYIIEEVRHDNGVITETEPHKIRQVISPDTSSEITAMLVYSTEEGVAKNAQVEGHLVAGKTGTSQTYKHGKPLSGAGTTITSFAGYGPIADPQFVILVKFDRPRENEWGSQTAAPTFSRIASYLFDYYNVPPDK